MLLLQNFFLQVQVISLLHSLVFIPKELLLGGGFFLLLELAFGKEIGIFYFSFIFSLQKMLDFIYDSLDTVKKLKFPTVKQITRLTLAIFALVLVAGTYFILADTIFSGGYKAFYSIMTEGQLPSS